MTNDNNSLKRTLTLLPVTLFGIAYMSPIIVFGTFGVLSETTKGLVTTAYLITIIAMLLTAYSYGSMVRAYPVAGSAYTYVRKSIGSNLGFMIGWILLLDYVFLPMGICVLSAYNLHAIFPAIPFWACVIIFIVPPIIVNILGVKLAANINFWMMMFQFSVIAIFLVLSIKTLLDGMGTGTLISSHPFINNNFSFSLIMSGAAIAGYSFLGFDAISTLTEETIQPEKTIPKAIILALLVCGVIFIVVSYFAQLVHPNYNFQHVNASGYELIELVGGNLFAAFSTAGSVIASLAAAIAAQASASRLLYVMGRDSVLYKRVFGYLHPRFKTPVLNLLLVGAVSLIALGVDVATATSFINFGAFVAFSFVNLSVIAHYFIKGNKRSPKGVLLYFISPAIGCIFNTWLLFNLDVHALTLGCIWALIGFVYLLFLTKMFRQRPPELNFNNVEKEA